MHTAVVTGGSKGIGREIVRKFISEEIHVITCGRNEDSLKALQAEIDSVHLSTVACDVSKRGDIDKLISQLPDDIDILVNNAGVFLPGNIHEEEEGQLEKMIDTNLYSAYHLSRGVIPRMKERKSGHIFNICSIASLDAYPPGGSYAISKFAMYGLSKGLRDELKEYGIKVTSILPGATYSASWEGTNIDQERLMKPEDVAEMIYATYKLSNHSVVEDILIRPQLGDL